VVNGIAHITYPVKWNTESRQKARCSVTVGESSNVVHAWEVLVGLVGEDKRNPSMACPVFEAVLPTPDIITVGVDDEGDAVFGRSG
jgi:hypothetical protein